MPVFWSFIILEISSFSGSVPVALFAYAPICELRSLYVWLNVYVIILFFTFPSFSFTSLFFTKIYFLWLGITTPLQSAHTTTTITITWSSLYQLKNYSQSSITWEYIWHHRWLFSVFRSALNKFCVCTIRVRYPLHVVKSMLYVRLRIHCVCIYFE